MYLLSLILISADAKFRPSTFIQHLRGGRTEAFHGDLQTVTPLDGDLGQCAVSAVTDDQRRFTIFLTEIFADASASKGFIDNPHRKTDFFLLAKEAQQGNASAMSLLGGCFALGLVHNRSDHRLAARCYLSAAQMVVAQNFITH